MSSRSRDKDVVLHRPKGTSGVQYSLFGALQRIDANMILCSLWIPRARATVQKRVGQLEGFAGIFQHRLLAVAASMRSPQNMESVRAKAADKGSDKLADILNSSITRAMTSPGGLYLYSVALCRVLETRDKRDGQPFKDTISVQITGSCNIPSIASAVVLNSTVVPSRRLDYLTLWASGGGPAPRIDPQRL